MKSLLANSLIPLALWGCVSTRAQERAIEDGSFDPTLTLRLIPDRSSACLGDAVTVTHEVRNDSEYPVWVCRLHVYQLLLGKCGFDVITLHQHACEEREVLDPGGEWTWDRDLELASCPCPEPEAGISGHSPAPSELMSCECSLSLSAKNLFHLVPPGKKWSPRWVAQTLEATGPVIQVSECD